jgi:hypothetical protein
VLELTVFGAEIAIPVSYQFTAIVNAKNNFHLA